MQAHPDNLKIFALRDIEWLVNPGSKNVFFCYGGSQAWLPYDLAMRAIQEGLAIRADAENLDEVRTRVREEGRAFAKSGQPPWPAVRINDLMAEPVFHSKFQPSPSLSPEFRVNTRANEPKKTVWIERGPEPQPEPGDDEQF